MGEILLSLPHELKVRILGFLPTKQDIANCRLVCRKFEELSKPTLVSRVTICKRFPALEQASKIIDSPSLQSYVREIIWDCSSYSKGFATYFENYIEACEGSHRHFRDQVSVTEDKRYSSFCQEVGLSYQPLPWQELTFENYEDDHVHATGMHGSFAEYFRRWHSQERIERDGVRFHLLRTALQRLPKLRRILFADFTVLIGDEEEHDDLCGRLFGNTLQPEYVIDPRELRSDFQKIQSLLETEDRQDVEIDTRGHDYIHISDP